MRDVYGCVCVYFVGEFTSTAQFPSKSQKAFKRMHPQISELFGMDASWQESERDGARRIVS